MRNLFKLLPLFLVASLTACSNNAYKEYTIYNCFSADVSLKIKVDKGEEELDAIGKATRLFESLDAISDAYKKRAGVTNIYDLNQTNERLEISEELYGLLNSAKQLQNDAHYFNPLVGSLSNAWKEAIKQKEPLRDSVIQEELTKINSSELRLTIEDNKYYAQRIGEALIDVGAIAKGYALDRCYQLLNQLERDDYLINAGSSSILFGVNSQKKSGLYTINLKDASDYYIYGSKCVVSTSGASQAFEKDNIKYTHIIDPYTGSAVAKHDTVIVMTNQGQGALGDVFATSMMMNTIEEIKDIEIKQGFKALVIDNGKVVYKNSEIKYE